MKLTQFVKFVKFVKSFDKKQPHYLICCGSFSLPSPSESCRAITNLDYKLLSAGTMGLPFCSSQPAPSAGTKGKEHRWC